MGANPAAPDRWLRIHAAWFCQVIARCGRFAAILHALRVPAPHFMVWASILTELLDWGALRYRGKPKRLTGYCRKDRRGVTRSICSGIPPKPQGARCPLAEDQGPLACAQGTSSFDCLREDRLLRAQPLEVAISGVLPNWTILALKRFSIETGLASCAVTGEFSETFLRLVTLIHVPNPFVGTFEAVS